MEVITMGPRQGNLSGPHAIHKDADITFPSSELNRPFGPSRQVKDTQVGTGYYQTAFLQMVIHESSTIEGIAILCPQVPGSFFQHGSLPAGTLGPVQSTLKADQLGTWVPSFLKPVCIDQSWKLFVGFLQAGSDQSTFDVHLDLHGKQTGQRDAALR
jgi:hypothetical protein